MKIINPKETLHQAITQKSYNSQRRMKRKKDNKVPGNTKLAVSFYAHGGISIKGQTLASNVRIKLCFGAKEGKNQMITVSLRYWSLVWKLWFVVVA